MSEEDKEKKNDKRYRGWVGVEAGMEGVSASVDDKLEKKKEKE